MHNRSLSATTAGSSHTDTSPQHAVSSPESAGYFLLTVSIASTCPPAVKRFIRGEVAMGNYPNVTVEWVPGWTPEVNFYDDTGKEVERIRIVHMSFANLQELLRVKGFVHKPQPLPPGGAPGLNPHVGTFAYQHLLQQGRLNMPGFRHAGAAHGQAGLVQPGQVQFNKNGVLQGQVHVIDPMTNRAHGQQVVNSQFPSAGSHTGNDQATDPTIFPSRGSHSTSSFPNAHGAVGAIGAHTTGLINPQALVHHFRGGRRVSEHMPVQSGYDRLKEAGLLDREGRTLDQLVTAVHPTHVGGGSQVDAGGAEVQSVLLSTGHVGSDSQPGVGLQAAVKESAALTVETQADVVDKEQTDRTTA